MWRDGHAAAGHSAACDSIAAARTPVRCCDTRGASSRPWSPRRPQLGTGGTPDGPEAGTVVSAGLGSWTAHETSMTTQTGFHIDFDRQLGEGVRFVQLTPPGSGCSIAIGHWGMPTQHPAAPRGCSWWSRTSMSRAPICSIEYWTSARYRTLPGAGSCSSAMRTATAGSSSSSSAASGREPTGGRIRQDLVLSDSLTTVSTPSRPMPRCVR